MELAYKSWTRYPHYNYQGTFRPGSSWGSRGENGQGLTIEIHQVIDERYKASIFSFDNVQTRNDPWRRQVRRETK